MRSGTGSVTRPYVPRTGAGLVAFRQRHNGLRQSDLARIAGVSQGYISQLETSDAPVPDRIHDRLTDWVAGKRSTGKRARSSRGPRVGRGPKIDGGGLPRSGSRLRALLDELEEQGISRAAVARGCYVTKSSLQQYTYLPDGKLPKKFRDNLREFLARIS